MLGFFVLQAALLIRSINKKIRKRVPLHLIGTLTTLLVAIFVIKVTLGAEVTSNTFILITLVASVIFFISYGLDSLYIIKNK
jgi:hypothetical protein